MTKTNYDNGNGNDNNNNVWNFCLACSIVMHCVVVEHIHCFLLIMHALLQTFQFTLVIVPSQQNLGFVTLHPFRISSPSWDGDGYLLEPHIFN